MRFNEFKTVDTINSLDKGEELAAPFTYTVKRGDSLWNIAKKHKDLGISYEELVASNPQIKNPDRIFPGEKITIPVKTANIPNVLPPDIERGRPTMKDDPRLKPNTEKPADPKDDGSYDRAEKARLGNHTAGKTDPKDDGSYDRAEKARLGNHPEKASEPPVVPPRDTTGDKGDAGRGKLSPGPLGKGKYKINDYTTTAKIFYFFKKNNFNDVQAAAITANAYVEGLYQGVEFNPKAKGDFDKITKKIPTAFGIFQWRFDRAAGLYAFSKRRSKSWTDLDLQLDWAMHELNNKYSDVVTALNSGKNTTDIATATHTFMRKYENPSYDPALNHYVDRIGYANTILDAFGTKQDKKPD